VNNENTTIVEITSIDSGQIICTLYIDPSTFAELNQTLLHIESVADSELRNISYSWNDEDTLSNLVSSAVKLLIPEQNSSESVVFSLPITITCSAPGLKSPSHACIAYATDSNKVWTCLDTNFFFNFNVSGGTISVSGQTNHFTSYAVLYDSDNSSSGGTGSSNYELVGIAVAVAAALVIIGIIVVIVVMKRRKAEEMSALNSLNRQSSEMSDLQSKRNIS